MYFWLFGLGLAVGSFINVLSLRYDPDRFLLNTKVMGGRSFCPHCRNKLKWFELVPLLSFVWLRGRCRTCQTKISFQYPIVELASALIFVLVPAFLKTSNIQLLTSGHQNSTFYFLFSIFYISVFTALLLISLIDIRLKLIPDEANIFIAILAVPTIILQSSKFGFTSGSFLGSYAGIFGLRENIWLNHGLALLFGVIFFLALILITRGRGMGVGDLKLAGALGLVFGWPDIVLITALSFILGSILSLPSLIMGKKGMKSFLPFGPFLALASLVVYFFGHDLTRMYFNLFSG
ncbi:MAG: prepilin peptidase [bacterium]|nr:prepilin peptidase [bacterium]